MKMRIAGSRILCVAWLGITGFTTLGLAQSVPTDKADGDKADGDKAPQEVQTPESSPAKALELTYKTYRGWDLVLPQESFARVSGDFRFPSLSSSPFTARLDGSALRIDRDADGELDAKVEGAEGLVTLRSQTETSDKFRYSVRLKRTNAGWLFAASGAVLGILDGQKIRIIDQNNNGRHDDYGEDAMVIGQGRYASFLSRVINVRGKLYSIEVSGDGRTLNYTPYVGATGTLDLSSRFATKGKLLSAIIRSEDGTISYNMTGGPMTVPVGEYRFYCGRIGLGRNVVNFSKGTVRPVTVVANETKSVAFGEPLDIDFQYVREPGRVIIDPKRVRYIGRAGEMYDDWTPFGGSPKFEVKDVLANKQIALAVFGGT